MPSAGVGSTRTLHSQLTAGSLGVVAEAPAAVRLDFGGPVAEFHITSRPHGPAPCRDRSGLAKAANAKAFAALVIVCDVMFFQSSLAGERIGTQRLGHLDRIETIYTDPTSL